MLANRSDVHPSRRTFLAGALAATTVPAAAHAATAEDTPRALYLISPHTGERFDAVYRLNGALRPGVMAELRHFLRDWRSGEETDIDPRVLDIVSRIQADIGAEEPLRLISGFRSLSTNAALRRRSGGVAKNSYHCRGMAIDIGHPSQRAATLRKAARRLRAGGVGYYPRSGFIHVDCGPVREWRG